MEYGPVAGLLILLVILIADVLLFGFGGALDAINRKELERRAQEDKDKKSILLQKVLDQPENYYRTQQLITTATYLLAGAMYFDFSLNTANILLKEYAGKYYGAILYAVLTFVLLVVFLFMILTFTVTIPQNLGNRKPEKWAYGYVKLMCIVMTICSPVIWVINNSIKIIFYLFGIRDSKNTDDMIEDEIISMVQEGHDQGLIEDSEARMISNIFSYGDKEVQDIMTHRNQVVDINGDESLENAMTFMLEEKYSRYPVYEENIDHIIGILHLKDAMRYGAEERLQQKSLKKLKGLLREPFFVPKTRKIDELFREMQSKKLQMVIVVDEYGQTDGLVAMEDILEEIVGNIQDEYDEDGLYIETKGRDEYIIDGKTPLEELEELLEISFEDENFETLNGFMIGKLDRIPEPGESFEVAYKGFCFKILDVENRMVNSVQVTKLPEGAEEAMTPEE